MHSALHSDACPHLSSPASVHAAEIRLQREHRRPYLAAQMGNDENPAAITPSARRHGVHDADILHALRNPRQIDFGDDGHIFVIGSQRDGAFLELVIVDDRADGKLRIIHAMPARRTRLR